MKRWYSDCVRHYLMLYLSDMEVGTPPKFKNTIEKEDWMACHSVMSALDPEDAQLVTEMYRRGDTLADNIYKLATARKTSQRTYWNLADDIEYKIAKKRGLIP